MAEIRIEKFGIEVTVAEIWSDGEPARTNGGVPAKQVQPTPTQTKMLDHVEYFDGFLDAAVFRLFRNYEIDVDVRVDEVAIGASSNGSLYSHQTVLLKMKDCASYRKRERWEFNNE